ncbi:MAG: hypothetical protein U1E76_11330 [Planctomycetota bacterium]
MDLLNAASVKLPCDACGGYEVTLRQILASHEVLHDGCCCARDESECAPRSYARVLDRETVEQLERAWRHLEDEVRRMGGEVLASGLMKDAK